jgi:hypothetical protein
LARLEAARDLDRASPSIRVALANAYLAAGRPASARREFQYALQFGADGAVVHLGLAVAWSEIAVPERARRHLLAALAMDAQLGRRAPHLPLVRRLARHPEFAPLIDTSVAVGRAAPDDPPELPWR